MNEFGDLYPDVITWVLSSIELIKKSEMSFICQTASKRKF